jgi:membrane fusion protein
MTELFRKEAVSHATQRLEGDVMIGAGVTWALLGYVCSAIVLIAFLFVAFASYTRKESVTGWVVPDGGIIRVAARDGGVISSLPVREGELVRAGAPMATIRLSTDTSNGDSGAIVEAAARSQRASTAQNAQSQIDKIEADRDQMVAHRAALQSMRAEAARFIDLLQAKAKLAADSLARSQALFDKGYLSRRNLDAANLSYLAAQQDVSAAKSNALALDQQLADTASQISATPILVAQTRAQAQANDASMRERLAQIQSSNEHTLTAPVSGKVIGLPVNLGQTVAVGAVVAIVAPSDSHLQAELFVPSRAAGFIKPGQPVSIHYQAFPYQRFGSARGRVVSVTHTVMAPGEIAISGLSLQEPVFRVRVALEKDFLSAYGVNTPVRPGMLLNADIVIDRRSLLEWLLDPLYAVGKRA